MHTLLTSPTTDENGKDAIYILNLQWNIGNNNLIKEIINFKTLRQLLSIMILKIYKIFIE